jgi:Ca2+-binding RTX toxin-like protein
MNEAQVSTLRYPGGTMTEVRTDLANPDSRFSNFMDPDPESVGPTVPLSSFLALCKSMNVGATIVLPTYRFLSETPDASGHRQVDTSEESNLQTYVKFAIQQSINLGTSLTAFEIGNEWHVDNSSIFGFRMSPVEYGRIANYMSALIQKEVDSFRLAGVLANAPEPAIVVQVGPGGEKELYTASGFRVTEDYKGPTLTATELIVRQITDIDARKAIDGVVMHRYMTVSDARAGDWVYSPFKTWESVSAKMPGFKAVEQYVSEWNVSARNKNEHGLKQFDSMFEMIREMLLSGVDHANVWAVQQNNKTRMIANTGADGSNYGGLTFGGIAFDIASTHLRGLKTLSAPEDVAGIAVNAFGSANRSVIVLTNRTDFAANHTVNLAKILKGGHHVTIYKISEGPDGKPTVLINTLASNSLELLYSLRFDAQESIVLVTAAGATGTTIEGYDRNDMLSGSSFGDTILGGDGNDTSRGGTGNDLILGEDGLDHLYGEDGNDTLDGGLGNDVVDGGAGDDLLIWSSGNDTINGGLGEDVLSFQSASGPVLLDLRTPQSLASLLGGSVLSEIEGFLGSSYSDTLIGAGLGDFLSGGAGSDHIYGGDGNDSLRGGADTDTVFGESGNDVINGEAGNDLLSGGSGDDTLIGAEGLDTLLGGEGNDLFMLSAFTDHAAGEVIVGDAGTDELRFTGATAGTLVLGAEVNVERVVIGTGTAAAAVLTGTTAINVDASALAQGVALIGNAGANRLTGSAFNDSLDGGVGNDALAGGAGDDTLVGGLGVDVASYASATAGLAIGLVANGQLTVAGFGTDSLSGIEGLEGGSGNDSLTGDAGANLLLGGAGNDTLVGGAGNDTLTGGDGTDTASYADAAAGVRVNLGLATAQATGGSGTEVLSGIENLIGSGFNDVLTGSAVANRIEGGVGNDILTGGAAADEFVFSGSTNGVDVITDFNGLNGGADDGDVLRFEGVGVGTFAYLGWGTFTGGSDNSEARVVGSQVLVDANGDGVVDITITLSGLTNSNQLTADDFLFV